MMVIFCAWVVLRCFADFCEHMTDTVGVKKSVEND